MDSLQRIRDAYEVGGRRIMRRVARTLMRVTGTLNPNAITVTGCLLSGVAGVLAFRGQFLAAAIVFLVGSLMDAMDGAVAKVTGKVTAFGAFLDSTLDRVGEGLVLGGLGLWFANEGNLWACGACFVALASSYLVSYTRAKAEAIGVKCKGGLASRVERVVLLTIGMGLATWVIEALSITVYVLAVTAALTVLQRVVHVHRALPDGRKPRRRRHNHARSDSDVQADTGEPEPRRE